MAKMVNKGNKNQYKSIATLDISGHHQRNFHHVETKVQLQKHVSCIRLQSRSVAGLDDIVIHASPITISARQKSWRRARKNSSIESAPRPHAISLTSTLCSPKKNKREKKPTAVAGAELRRHF